MLYHVNRGGRTCNAAIVELKLTLLFAFYDTAPTEANHAALRRGLMSLSVQTLTQAATVVSADEVLRRFRKFADVARPFVQSAAAAEVAHIFTASAI